MPYCINCGVQVGEKDKICFRCGQKLDPKDAEPVHAASEPYTKSSEPAYYATSQIPVQLPTNRSLLKFILLSLVTFGIYGIVVMSAVSTDINTIATRYDGKKTMHYCLILFVFSWLTCGIASLVWCHRLCARIGRELNRRGIPYAFGAGTFWGWGLLGSFIFVGPFIYTHKLLSAMNQLSASYNVNG